ncbi:hypothetical protein GCM10017668_00880 [Streptomyces tuirus]|uniref:Uncharacterized protein n=1 Tax=Streptomyces tuirus TaxID=68278 RepID=A0A7G1NAM4_9ACTN|nr:hypothetical protein GCM10017668_00880 [Streptomyces tuirus]
MDSPVAAADPVISRTSRFCTVSCIHVPAFDTKFATDHQRMLRYLSDRQGEREAALAGAGDGWTGESDEDTVRYSQDESEDSAGGTRGTRNTGCAARWLPSPDYGADHRGRSKPTVGLALLAATIPRSPEMPRHQGIYSPEWGCSQLSITA